MLALSLIIDYLLEIKYVYDNKKVYIILIPL